MARGEAEMFCPNCGSELPDDSKFCTQCGFDLSEARARANGAPADGAVGGDAGAGPVPPTSGEAPEAATGDGDGDGGRPKGKVPKWLVVMAIVLAVVVAGLAAYAITTSVTGRGQTSAQKVVKKPTDTKGKSGASSKDSGKSDASGSGDGGSSATTSKDNGTSTNNNGTSSSNGGSATTNDSAYVVEAEHFRCTLPSYWRDKVDVVKSDDGLIVFAKGYENTSAWYKEELAELHYMDGTEPDVAGDIGYAMMYSQAIGDHHVEVWVPNWPWLVADANANGSLDSYGVPTEGLRTLIDLSTGGKIGYDQVLQLGEDDERVSMACYDFISSQAWDVQAVGE
ncbi:MAG: zinc-ribbon domain-containing protein [Parafannyhessea sp.]|uniref:zinc ribbon domain-containing protein n=1 Tax=Parafannyhessea sp. TaxID=2847324 RepID=UPI003EFFDD07